MPALLTKTLWDGMRSSLAGDHRSSDGGVVTQQARNLLMTPVAGLRPRLITTEPCCGMKPD